MTKLPDPNQYRFRQFYIPDRMMVGLRAWIEEGRPTGSFLKAVLRNDLREACALADDENLANLPAYVGYLHNEAPSLCHGSPERVKEWFEKHEKEREAKLPK